MITQATAIKPATSQTERPLITIEFAPDIHPEETEYEYSHPQFVFGNCVTLINEYPETEYTVCALELIESKTPSGKLLSQPRWKYKISDGQQTYWKEESALTRVNTCSTCQHFEDFHEPNGRGWCVQFDHQSRTHHIKTNDCVQGSASTELIDAFPTEEIIDEADLPRSQYQVGSIVKVIDSQEHHSEWAIFEVIKCFHNQERYRTTESYLSETDWYYTISSLDEVTQFFVSEIEICDADMSWNINTEDIF